MTMTNHTSLSVAEQTSALKEFDEKWAPVLEAEILKLLAPYKGNPDYFDYFSNMLYLMANMIVSYAWQNCQNGNPKIYSSMSYSDFAEIFCNTFVKSTKNYDKFKQQLDAIVRVPWLSNGIEE